MSLSVYSTKYSRGAVVKLAASHSDRPLVKFVIERKHGQAGIRIDTADDLGHYVQTPTPGLTEAQFIEYAERECERIRTVLGGAHGGR